MQTEVLIVGAGPVGLTLAVELARYGVSVRVLDKAAQRSDQSRAIVVWSRTLELLDRGGYGEAFVAAGMRVAAANIVAGGKSIGRIELGGVASPHSYALMLAQNETERLLEEALNALGVQVERGVELLSFTEGLESVSVGVRRSDGIGEKVLCSWLVGCDGAHSTVRHGLHMVFTGDTQPSNWILADVELQGMPAPLEIEVAWHAEGILAIFPFTPGRYRVIADAGPSHSANRPPDPTLKEVQAMLDRRGRGGIIASDPRWLATFHINERKVVDYRRGRVFLAGDAAHVHNPSGAQGMNTGMQDAFNLAWKLALVCRGAAAEEPLLNSYSTERSAVGERVLKSTGRLTSVAIVRGDMKQKLRNHMASMLFGFGPVREALADAITEVAIEYPESPLNARGPHAHGGPSEGERAPFVEGEPPFGTGDRPRFAVCADISLPAAKRAAGVLLGLYTRLVEEDVRAPLAAGGIWLVRPDGYVALTTGDDGWDNIAAYLDRVVGRLTKWRVQAIKETLTEP